MSSLNSEERLVPDNADFYSWSENYARYFFVGNFVKKKKVLDIGCGTGYGTNFLITAGANSAMGIDNSFEAIEYAKTHYQDNNLNFKQMDIGSLDLPSKSFDVVVALEVIEHLHHPTLLLKEIKRLLKDDGLAILSTPNQREHPKIFFNKYHVHEMDFSELNKILKENFKSVKIFGFGFFLGSYICPLEEIDFHKFKTDVELLEKFKETQPPFFIALCKLQSSPFANFQIFYPYSLSRYDYVEYFKKNGDFGDKINVEQFLFSLIRFFINEKKDFKKTLPLLEKILKIEKDNPELNYLAAYCLHNLNQEHDKALQYYDIALAKGFDEFWVRYNRGSLLFKLGKTEDAHQDLKKAIHLKPDHVYAKKLYSQILETKNS